MTGPEHYREAERLLDALRNIERSDPQEVSLIAEANVHATLALAAAVGGLGGFTPFAAFHPMTRTVNDASGWFPIVDPVGAAEAGPDGAP